MNGEIKKIRKKKNNGRMKRTLIGHGEKKKKFQCFQPKLRRGRERGSEGVRVRKRG